MAVQADLMIRERVTLSTSGDSEVHLTGYLTTTELLAPEDDNDEEYEGAERVRPFGLLTGLLTSKTQHRCGVEFGILALGQALNIAEDALDGQEFEGELW